MQGKRGEDYEAVYREIKNRFPEEKPHVGMSDFEQGLRTALQKVFTDPKIEMGGCLFHHFQVLAYSTLLIYNLIFQNLTELLNFTQGMNDPR